MKTCKKSVLALSIQASLLAAAVGLSPALFAQESDKDQAAEETKLERIMVTAQNVCKAPRKFLSLLQP